MHKSNVNQRSQAQHKHRFQSTNKQNYNLQKGQNYPCIKDDIYHKKLMEMYSKYSHIAAYNSQKLEELRERVTLYRTISERQAVKLQSSQITMAKEEYMTEIVTNKSDINRMQQLVANVTQEHQATTLANNSILSAQQQKQILQQRKLMTILQQIVQVQTILNLKKYALSKEQQIIDSNRQQLELLQQKQGKYLGLMSMIDARERSKQ